MMGEVEIDILSGDRLILFAQMFIELSHMNFVKIAVFDWLAGRHKG